MDKAIFPSNGAHLRRAEPCAPGPFSAVAHAGTKVGEHLRLWITRVLRENSPQGCPLAVVGPGFPKNNLPALLMQCLKAIDSIAMRWTVRCATPTCSYLVLSLELWFPGGPSSTRWQSGSSCPGAHSFHTAAWWTSPESSPSAQINRASCVPGRCGVRLLIVLLYLYR